MRMRPTVFLAGARRWSTLSLKGGESQPGVSLLGREAQEVAAEDGTVSLRGGTMTRPIVIILCAAVLAACGTATVEPTPIHPIPSKWAEPPPIEEYPEYWEEKYWESVGATAQAEWLEMMIAEHDAWYEHVQKVEADVERIYYEVFPDRERLPLEGIALQLPPRAVSEEELPPTRYGGTPFIPPSAEESAEYDRAWALNEKIVELYSKGDIASVKTIFNDPLWQKWFMPPAHLQ